MSTAAVCIQGMGDTIFEAKNKHTGTQSILECWPNVRVSSETLDPDMRLNRSDEKTASLRTPSDTDIRIKYHKTDLKKLQRCQATITRSLFENKHDSTPRTIGMITLRRINLIKPFCNQNCVVATPDAYASSKYSLSNSLNNSLVDCEPATNKPTSTLQQLNQPEVNRVPTFVSCIKERKSLCNNIRINKICDSGVQKRKTSGNEQYGNRLESSVNSGSPDKMKSLCHISRKPLTFSAQKHLKSAPSDIAHTTRNDNNCNHLIETSYLTNVEFQHECNIPLQQSQSNIHVFNTPTALLQPLLIQMQSTPQPFQLEKPKKSYCGNISISSFEDCSFSPVWIILPPESPEEMPDVVIEKSFRISDKHTSSETKKQNMSVSSEKNMHNETDRNVLLESIHDKLSGNMSVCNTEINNKSMCINEPKVIEKRGVKKTSNVATSLKTDGASESHKQRKTRASIKQKHSFLEEEHGKRSTGRRYHMIRSEHIVKPKTSGNSRHEVIDMHPESEHTQNCIETSPVIASSESQPISSQSIASSKLQTITNACKNKHVMNTRSTRANNLSKESSLSLETQKANTLTNGDGQVLKKKKHENLKVTTDFKKDNIIAINTAEMTNQKHRKKSQVHLTESCSRRSALEYKNEMVTNVNKSIEKWDKQGSVKAYGSLNNSLGSRNKVLNISETNRRSYVTDTSSKLAVRANSLRTDSQKLCPPVTTLNLDKKQGKKRVIKHCQSHDKNPEQLNFVEVKRLRVKSRSSVLKYFPVKSQRVDGCLDVGGNTKEIIYPGCCKNQDCAQQNISSEERNLSGSQSTCIHLQSSFSKVHSDVTKPGKKMSVPRRMQNTVTLISKIMSSQNKKSPEDCNGNLNTVSDQSVKSASPQKVQLLSNCTMSLRKRKMETVTAGYVQDADSSIKLSTVTRSNLRHKNKEQTKFNAQEEHIKVHKNAKKQSSKKESISEVAIDNRNVKTTQKRIVTRQRVKETATLAVSEGSSIEHDVHPHNQKLLKSKVEPRNEEISFVTKQASQKFVGGHCSIAGGVSNAVMEAVSIGARAFGLFVRSGRTWKLNPFQVAEAENFKKACEKHGFLSRFILPHGSFLLNCGSSNPDILQKSRDTLIHELQICEMLGLEMYNFHPGSACGKGTLNECLMTVAESINIAHKKTSSVRTVIENMSCQGNTVGGKFEELKIIIDNVKDKSRIGVCLDTCHAFAAGFDLSSEDGFNKFIEDFDKIVGLKYLCAMHLNDSKGELGCHLDRHENIGKGHIGLEGFRCVMNDPRLNNIPMILETPVNDYAKEIKILCDLENL